MESCQVPIFSRLSVSSWSQGGSWSWVLWVQCRAVKSYKKVDHSHIQSIFILLIYSFFKIHLPTFPPKKEPFLTISSWLQFTLLQAHTSLRNHKPSLTVWTELWVPWSPRDPQCTPGPWLWGPSTPVLLWPTVKRVDAGARVSNFRRCSQWQGGHTMLPPGSGFRVSPGGV
jgi:hypothetical protein